MTTDGPLTEQDLERLHTLGYIKVRVFPAEDAAEMEETIWRRLKKEGVLRDDPTTWGKYPSGLSRAVRASPIFRKAVTTEFAAIVDQLVGRGQWHPPKDKGSLLYTFPEDLESWDVSNQSWHWHGNPLRNVGGLRDIFIFSFLTRVAPQGGGTVLVEGSHHAVCDFFSQLTPEQRQIKTKDLKRKFYASHPWLRELNGKLGATDRRPRFMETTTDVLGHPLRVVELTGEPGEAYITNMSTLHARSFNILDQPRFMTAKGIDQLDVEHSN
jgi:hypothetical protein